MGFRNPLTSLSANQITAGTLPPGIYLPASQVNPGTLDPLVIAQGLAAGTVGTNELAFNAVTSAKIAVGAVLANAIAAGAIIAGKIAAGAIDAMTITGALVRSAATGNRFELQQVAGIGTLKFFAGFVGETPATLKVSTLGGAVPAQMLSITGDTNISGTYPEIDLYSQNAPAGGYQSVIDIAADVVHVKGVPLVSHPYYGAALVGGVPALGVQLIEQIWIGDVTTNSNGDTTLHYPVPFPNGVLNVRASRYDFSVFGPTSEIANTVQNVYDYYFRVYSGGSPLPSVGSLYYMFTAVGW